MIATNFPLPSNQNREFEDCLACRVLSAVGLTGAGGYLLFNPRFRDQTSDFYRDVKPQHLRFVHSSTRLAGVVMIGLGILRAGDGIFWRKTEPVQSKSVVGGTDS